MGLAIAGEVLERALDFLGKEGCHSGGLVVRALVRSEIVDFLFNFESFGVEEMGPVFVGAIANDLGGLVLLGDHFFLEQLVAMHSGQNLSLPVESVLGF